MEAMHSTAATDMAALHVTLTQQIQQIWPDSTFIVEKGAEAPLEK